MGLEFSGQLERLESVARTGGPPSVTEQFVELTQRVSPERAHDVLRASTSAGICARVNRRRLP